MKENSLLSILRNTGVLRFGFSKDVPLGWFESGLIRWVPIFEENVTQYTNRPEFYSNIDQTIPGQTKPYQDNLRIRKVDHYMNSSNWTHVAYKPTDNSQTYTLHKLVSKVS